MVKDLLAGNEEKYEREGSTRNKDENRGNKNDLMKTSPFIRSEKIRRTPPSGGKGSSNRRNFEITEEKVQTDNQEGRQKAKKSNEG